MATVDERTDDRFDSVMGDQRGSGRLDDPVAVVSIIMSTPVSDYENNAEVASQLVRKMHACAEALTVHAAAVQQFLAAGWTVSAPTIEADDDFRDISIELRKCFLTPEAAHADARACRAGADPAYPVTLSWNEKLDFDGPAYEAYDWCEEIA